MKLDFTVADIERTKQEISAIDEKMSNLLFARNIKVSKLKELRKREFN